LTFFFIIVHVFVFVSLFSTLLRGLFLLLSVYLVVLLSSGLSVFVNLFSICLSFLVCHLVYLNYALNLLKFTHITPLCLRLLCCGGRTSFLLLYSHYSLLLLQICSHLYRTFALYFSSCWGSVFPFIYQVVFCV